MQNIRKRVLLVTAFSALLGIGINQPIKAQESKIYPITNQMVNAINNASNADAAIEALCKQGGVLRGSGSTAGNMCTLQDFARIALVACGDYVNGRDSFQDSKCNKNAAKASITDGTKAADSIKASLNAKVPYLTNTKLLLCGPESLGAGVAKYRDKLPEGLKKIAAEGCGAPARPTQAAPSLCPGATPAQLKQVASGLGLQPPVEFTSDMKKSLNDTEVQQVVNEVTLLLNNQTAAVCVLDGLKQELTKATDESKKPTLKTQQQSLANEYTKSQEMLTQISMKLAQKAPLGRETLVNTIKQRQLIEASLNNAKKMCCNSGLWIAK